MNRTTTARLATGTAIYRSTEANTTTWDYAADARLNDVHTFTGTWIRQQLGNKAPKLTVDTVTSVEEVRRTRQHKGSRRVYRVTLASGLVAQEVSSAHWYLAEAEVTAPEATVAEEDAPEVTAADARAELARRKANKAAKRNGGPRQEATNQAAFALTAAELKALVA